MDSFYDVPRRPPQPIPRTTFSATPVVPDISVLCPSNTLSNPFTPYNQWKKDVTPNNFLILNKENINGHYPNTQNTSILKKVRFESPVHQQKLLGSSEPFLNKTGQHLNKNQTENDSNHKPHEQGTALTNFEQMYMANIPNRQLDLSVIDMPKRVLNNESKNQCIEGKVFQKEGTTMQHKEQEQPKTYKEFLESQNKIILNDSVTDIFNYKKKTMEKDFFSPSKSILNEKSVEMGGSNFEKQYCPELGPYDYQPIQKHHRQENNEKRKPSIPEHCFHSVTEAISQRNVPLRYENLVSPTVPKISTYDTEKNNGSSKSGMPQNYFSLENNDCENSQNKLPYQSNVQNLDKSSPQEIGRKGSNSEDTRNKYSAETLRFGHQNGKNNKVILETQANNGSETIPTVLSCNLLGQDFYKTSSYPLDSEKKRECYTQTTNELANFENNALSVKCEDELSVKDLLKIIAQQSRQMAQQNEQLFLLQKQVSEFVCKQKNIEGPGHKMIECEQQRNCYQQNKNCCKYAMHCCSQQKSREHHCEEKPCFAPGLLNKNMKNLEDRYLTSTQHENYDGKKPKLQATPKKNKMPNFSIGLTTSFEVSFRRPQHNKGPNDFLQRNKQLPDDHYEPVKIQELTETESVQSDENIQRNDQQNFQKSLNNDNKETLVDASMVFKEPIRVRESCPSPEPSINIDMNDFEDSESEDDLRSPEIGSSFYRNLMVQVNKILQKAEIETTDEMVYNFKGRHLKTDTLHKVKEATLKHLRKIGVDVQNSENSSQSNSSCDHMDNKSYDQDDISFAVKQLLMKYLPADHLAKVAYKEAHDGSSAVLTPKEKIGAIKRRPDFSFATVQYMKKYNLIANNQKDIFQMARHNQSESPKILDISKLKQQPKLL